MLFALAFACSLPPLSDTGARVDSGASVDDPTFLCEQTLVGPVTANYQSTKAAGGCSGPMTLWCSGGISGTATLACDGVLSSLELDLSGVVSGSELGGDVAVTGPSAETFAGQWAGDVQDDLTVDGGFETTGSFDGAEYSFSGAFSLAPPGSI